MSLKKKGTPEKIEVVVPADLDLTKWKKLINKAINSVPFILTTEDKSKPKKDKK